MGFFMLKCLFAYQYHLSNQNIDKSFKKEKSQRAFFEVFLEIFYHTSIQNFLIVKQQLSGTLSFRKRKRAWINPDSLPLSRHAHSLSVDVRLRTSALLASFMFCTSEKYPVTRRILWICPTEPQEGQVSVSITP